MGHASQPRESIVPYNGWRERPFGDDEVEIGETEFGCRGRTSRIGLDLDLNRTCTSLPDDSSAPIFDIRL